MRPLIGSLLCLLCATSSSHTLAAKSPACVYRSGGALPDRACTPGATNPDVTQDTIGLTICVKGWTGTVRPGTSVTEPKKIRSMREYGNRFGKSATRYEYDHLIPLELGGAVIDRRNLWPEPRAARFRGRQVGSQVKDTTENLLNKLVCKGKMTLARAQKIEATDWREGKG